MVPHNARATKSLNEAKSIIRLSIIKQILSKQSEIAKPVSSPVAIRQESSTWRLVTFITQPYYARNANFAVTVRSGEIVASFIQAQDDLDLIIKNALIRLGSGKQDIIFSNSDIRALGQIYLWKSTQDLKDLWYQVVSSRYRTNYDAAYRRHNIITAFGYLGHAKVLNPGDSFNYLASIHYDPKAKKNYKNGLAIVQDEEIPVYGWGICWGSTATYQWLVTNLGLKLGARNHSKRFSDLYTAIINGQKIATPGIDATVFAGSVDLKVTNISDHPIIVVLNFNGNYGWIEETMSLWLAQDKGSLEFVSKKTSMKKKNKIDKQTGSGYVETVKTGCYTRKINGKNKTSCYREIW